MGYTHYWDHQEISPENWDRICEDTRKLIAASTIKVQYEYDNPSEPIICNVAIQFNGAREDGHETFWMTPALTDFQFCKTDQKPYDALVVAVLAVMEDIEPSMKVRSDGEVKDWRLGVEFATEVLGREISIPNAV